MQNLSLQYRPTEIELAFCQDPQIEKHCLGYTPTLLEQEINIWNESIRKGTWDTKKKKKKLCRI